MKKITPATASIVVLPMMMVGTRAVAQVKNQPVTSPVEQLSYRFHKLSNPYTILGVGGGHTIYKTAEGTYFYLDPNTGDMKTVAPAEFIKLKLAGPSVGGYLYKNPGEGTVTIVGIDSHGNVLSKNSRGEEFYLNPKTGDLVFVNR